MQTFNFRLYGEYIYGLLSKYLTEYINPKINKEEFIFDFKNGILNLHIDKLNKPINILPLLYHTLSHFPVLSFTDCSPPLLTLAK